MNGKKLLESLMNSNFMIPSQESIIKFAVEQWITIFKEWRWFSYSYKVGLVLDIDIENPEKIKEYFLDDWKWILFKIDDNSLWIKKSFDLIIDPVIDDWLFDQVNDFKLKIVHNSVYDEVFAIINNGILIDLTDYDKV